MEKKEKNSVRKNMSHGLEMGVTFLTRFLERFLKPVDVPASEGVIEAEAPLGRKGVVERTRPMHLA